MRTLVLGERLNGIQEVSGSIPLISTISWEVKKKKLVLETKRAFFFPNQEGRQQPPSWPHADAGYPADSLHPGRKRGQFGKIPVEKIVTTWYDNTALYLFPGEAHNLHTDEAIRDLTL